MKAREICVGTLYGIELEGRPRRVRVFGFRRYKCWQSKRNGVLYNVADVDNGGFTETVTPEELYPLRDGKP